MTYADLNWTALGIRRAHESLNKASRLLAVFVPLLGVLASRADAACSCGPDYCQDDPRVTTILKNKKASLSKSYPKDLLALLDRGDQCVARITRSPDIFTIWYVSADGSKGSTPWSSDSLHISKTKLASGELKRFWIVHAQRAFSCCGQPNYDKQKDYDAEDDVNASLAIKCDASHAC